MCPMYRLIHMGEAQNSGHIDQIRSCTDLRRTRCRFPSVRTTAVCQPWEERSRRSAHLFLHTSRKHKSIIEMNGDAYPDVPDVDSFIAGKLDAVHVQLVFVSKRYPGRVREFALVAARAVADKFCQHGHEPPRRLEGSTWAS